MEVVLYLVIVVGAVVVTWAAWANEWRFLRDNDERYSVSLEGERLHPKPREHIMRSTPPDPIEEILARPPRRRTDRPTE